ncbi:hypothetical protein MNV49_001038 [Pseudohyphozyma bogoriensis]|nr:hypothetical protein MNV49_001038 [Pseudohyphozyma bogoriensis]
MKRGPAEPAASTKRVPPSRRAHACPTCAKVFSRAEFVRRHQKLKHVDQAVVFECKTCDVSFARREQLEAHHTLTHNSTPDNPFLAQSAAEPVALGAIAGEGEAEVGGLKAGVRYQVELEPVTARPRRRRRSADRIRNYDEADEEEEGEIDADGSEDGFNSDRSERERERDLERRDSRDVEARFYVETAAANDPVHQVSATPRNSLALPPPPHAYAQLSPPVASTSTAVLPPMRDFYNPAAPPDYPPLGHPEDLSQYGFMQNPMNPLDLQLLLDSCQFPGVGGYVAQGKVRVKHGLPGGRTMEFNVRVTAMIGNPEDWEEADRGLQGLIRGSRPSSGALTKGTRFFAPAQQFCIGYKSPWHVPPLPKLSRYAALASSFFLSAIPVVHQPTMFEESMTPQLAFALSVVGAGYEHDGRAFHDQMTKEKRIFGILHLHELELTPEESFSCLQSLMVYNFLGLTHLDPDQRTYSAPAHDLLIEAYRARNLPTLVQSSAWEPHPRDAPPQEIEASWRAWIRLETYKRLTYLTFVLDLEMTVLSGAAQLQPYELSLDMPAWTVLWEAPDAQTWHTLLHTLPGALQRPPPFLSMLDAVLCLDWPAAGTPAAALIPTLRETNELGLHVLQGVLERLEKQLQRQMEEEAHGGHPIVDYEGMGRDRPERALGKVRNGYRLLKMVGGWQRRERWFGGVGPIFQNYAAHIKELNNATPTEPFFFLKPTSSYVTNNGPVEVPKGVTVHHEVELGVVIGKGGRDILAKDAYSHVAGYTLAIDYTGRNMQDAVKKKGLPWSAAKGFDTFCPVGPFIPASKIKDPQNLDLWYKVNGETKQAGNTNLMLYQIPELIQHVSSITTLEEGDLLLTGTPEGVGPVVPGDKVTAGLVQDGETLDTMEHDIIARVGGYEFVPK